MAKIARFPVQSGQGPEALEGLIRKYLAEMIVDPDSIEAIAERMMFFIDNYLNIWFNPAFDLVVPPMSQEQADALLLSLEKGVDAAAEQINTMVNRIIIERLFLEVEIYQNQKSVKRPRKLL